MQNVFHVLALEFEPLLQQIDGVEIGGQTLPVVQDVEVERVESELDLAAEQLDLPDILHVVVEFVAQHIHTEVDEVVQAETFAQVAQVERDFLPIDPYEVLVLDLQGLVLDQLLEHVGQFLAGPAFLKVRVVELRHSFVVIVVDHLELLLLVGVQVYDGLFGHAEPGWFDFLVGVGHEDVGGERFVQVRVVGQVLGQVGDVVHEQLLHFGFEHFLDSHFLIQVLEVVVELAFLVHVGAQDAVAEDLPLALGVAVLRVEQVAHEHVAALHVEQARVRVEVGDTAAPLHERVPVGVEGQHVPLVHEAELGVQFDFERGLPALLDDLHMLADVLGDLLFLVDPVFPHLLDNSAHQNRFELHLGHVQVLGFHFIPAGEFLEVD